MAEGSLSVLSRAGVVLTNVVPRVASHISIVRSGFSPSVYFGCQSVGVFFSTYSRKFKMHKIVI